MRTLQNLHDAIGGRLKAATGAPGGSKATPLGPVVTDSRRIARGDVFWALAGPNFNGADFTEEAFARGASGAVVGRQVEAPSDRWLLTVGDTQRALATWARLWRRQFTGTVIGVTGSAGKTTTRHMIHTVLKTRLVGTASPENYNNHVGVPLSLLGIELEHDYAVIELAASRRGEIAALADLAAPTIGAITNVGDAHLGGFGSRRAIAEAKAELLAALPPDGQAVLSDDPRLRRVAGQCRAAVTWVGRHADGGLAATDVHWSRGRLHFRVGGCRFCVPVWGRHHLHSALIAVAVGRLMGFDLSDAAAVLESFHPVPMRCEVTDLRGATVINDTYNASPTAMRAALELLREVDASGQRIFVCGDMGQLGRRAAELHRRLGHQTVTLAGIDRLIACGAFAGHVVAAARQAGMPRTHAVACRTPEEALPHLQRTILPGDVVLVKGARAMAMERVVEAMKQGPELSAA